MFVIAYNVRKDGQISILIDGRAFYGDLHSADLPCTHSLSFSTEDWSNNEERLAANQRYEEREKVELDAIKAKLYEDDDGNDAKIDGDFLYIKIKGHKFEFYIDNEFGYDHGYTMATLEELKGLEIESGNVPIETIFQHIRSFEN